MMSHCLPLDNSFIDGANINRFQRATVFAANLFHTIFCQGVQRVILIMLFTLTWPSVLFAYPTWSANPNTNTGNCADCHGDFEEGNYVSFASDDAADWGMTLMNGHVSRYGLACTDCHDTLASAPVALNSSLSGITCVSCHGREEDITANDGAFGSSTPGRGDGLRARHARAGITICSACHTADTVPVGENIAPATFLVKGIDPCNENSYGSLHFGSAGLDNDGDGQRDMADSDCATANTAPVANNDSAATQQDTPTTINVLANDTDADGDSLSINNVDGTSVFGGTVTCDMTGGLCTYTPALGFSGEDSFTYNVSDGSSVSAMRATVTINVTPLPNRAPSCGGITPTMGQVGMVLNFTAAVSDPDGDALSYAWDFGDGGVSSETNPSHRYSTAGSYTVNLTVDDGRGGNASCSTVITVSEAPPENLPPTCSDIAPSSGLAGMLLNFTATASDPNGDPLTYLWDFGDGSNSTQASPIHSYVSAGSYSVSLTVDDGNSGTASCSALITISEPPPANQAPVCSAITPTAGQVGSPVNFSATASDPDGDPLTYSWDFGDGLVSSASNPAHTFTTAGTFNVNLSVSDGRGASGACNAAVIIAAAPPPASDGEALYNSRCVFCHGDPADPTGMGPVAFTVPGASSCSIRGAIYNPAPWGVETMASLLQGAITDSEIDLIAGYLSAFNTGAQLYNTMCSRCHGANGNGDGLAHERVSGASAAEISEAIREESVMRYLSCLLDHPADLNSIATYLGGQGNQGGGAGGDGANNEGDEASHTHHGDAGGETSRESGRQRDSRSQRRHDDN